MKALVIVLTPEIYRLRSNSSLIEKLCETFSSLSDLWS